MGVALGYLVHNVFVMLLAGLVESALPAPSLWPVAFGLGMGLTLLFAFGLPPVLQLAQVPPLRVIRRDVGGPKPASLAVLGIGVAGFAALLLAVSSDIKLGLIAVGGFAGAVALFAGNNQGTITLYWPPYRIDLSLNMVLLLLVGGFVTLYAALRALAALLELPHQARRWRVQQKERAMHAALLDALTHMLGGRFIRSRKAAVAALSQEHALEASGEAVPHGKQLRALAHMIAAEASHALQDRATRESHLQDALQEAPMRGTVNEQEMHEGAQMRAARW
eukprot:gene16620-34609_t